MSYAIGMMLTDAFKICDWPLSVCKALFFVHSVKPFLELGSSVVYFKFKKNSFVVISVYHL